MTTRASFSGAVIAESDEIRTVAGMRDLPGDRVEVNRLSVAVGAEQGFVKLLAARRRIIDDLGGGRLASATLVAPHRRRPDARGSDRQINMFVGRLAPTHAYRTWANAVQQAALQ